MTKVIENIELLKKLQPYLEDVETEYVYTTISRMLGDAEASNEMCLERTEDHTPMCLDYKTLTLEEAIALLNKVKRKDLEDCFDKFSLKRGDVLFYVLGGGIEIILEYLIDNDLLGNQ